ncbi:NAD(P)H-dependent oxidoreductase [Tellurirhabdus rosea]|uniref:NAD(P)H-dependent oxidoreductase n=1 Tax=Tellurirhabdus rosea TaxID=2674997 RepID=UPI0022564D92|nr:NAD(P)H-dependent oxidoreductase [Tellurirhabdus rosea]
MKTVIMSASPRAQSGSLRVAHFLEKILKEHETTEVSVVSFEHYDVPLVGQGQLDPDNLTDFQQTVLNAWKEADLVFFLVPEYNWTTSPQLLNLLHQAGGPKFAHLFDNKVFAVAGTSGARGGRVPALEVTTVLNKLINFLNKYSIVSPRIWESHETSLNLNESGESTGNAIYEKAARAFVEYSLNVAQRWNVGSLVE